MAGGSCPRALTFALATSRKNFDGDEVPSGHFIMPRCDLLKVILQDNAYRYLRFFGVSKYEKKTNLRLPLYVQKLRPLIP